MYNHCFTLIILLTSKYTVFNSDSDHKKFASNSDSQHSNYLYDVENDKIVPFIHDYDLTKFIKKNRPVDPRNDDPCNKIVYFIRD